MIHPGRSLRLLAFALVAASLAIPARPQTQTQTPLTTHHLLLNNVVQSVDAHGRFIFVATVRGDMAGVLTLAVSVDATGAVKSGEWAYNAARLDLGAPVRDNDGDGDSDETLVRLGFLKGTVSGGNVVVAADGHATELGSIRLNLTGATVKFAGIHAGSGIVGGTNMQIQNTSSGFLTLTF